MTTRLSVGIVLPSLAPRRDPAQEGRRAEQVRRAEVVDRLEQLHRVNLRGPGRVHVGNDRRHPQRRGEEGKQGKGAEVDFARLDRVERTEELDLGLEDRVCIHGTFGRSGTSTGEQHRRRVVRAGRAEKRRPRPPFVEGPLPHPAEVVQRGEGRPSPPRRDLDHPAYRFTPPTQDAPGPQSLGDADENLGGGLAQARPQRLEANPRIDQNGNDCCLEEREGEGEEVEAGLDHDGRPGSRVDARLGQPAGNPVAVLVKLTKGQVAVTGPASGAAYLGNHNGRRVRLTESDRVKMLSNVELVG